MYGCETLVLEDDIDLPFDFYYPLPEVHRANIIYAIHGASENRYRLRNFACYFVNKGNIVVVPTLRSHKDNSTEGSRSYLNLAFIIKDMFEIQKKTKELAEEREVSIDKRVLVGNSIGGLIASYLASRTTFKKDALICFDCLGDIKGLPLFSALFAAKNSPLHSLIPYMKNLNLKINNLLLNFDDMYNLSTSIDDFCIEPRDMTYESLEVPLFSIHCLDDYLIPTSCWELFSRKAYENPDEVHMINEGVFKGHRFLYLSNKLHSNAICDTSLYPLIEENLEKMLIESSKNRIGKNK